MADAASGRGLTTGEVIATVANNNKSLFLAEAILAALEAFLATSLSREVLPCTSRLQLKVAPSDFMSEPLEFSVTTVPHTAIEIRHPPGDSSGAEDAGLFSDKLIELISNITAHTTFVPEGSRDFLEQVVKNELGLGRALMLAGVETMIRGILGNKPKLRISDWTAECSKEEVAPLRRGEPWNQTASREQPSPKAPTWGSGEPPRTLLRPDRLKHRDRKVFSLINIGLWDKAGWMGTGFVISSALEESPYLALLFRNREAAAAIFEAWREEVGQRDSKEKLRVSILTGVDRDSPAVYRVTIGANPDFSTIKPGGHAVMISRINEMHPEDSTNLDMFLARFKRTGSYILMPAVGQDGGFVPAPSLGVLKHELIVRPAWQVGEHDPDTCAIEIDDKVIIPDGVANAPILKALERIKRMRPKRKRRKT